MRVVHYVRVSTDAQAEGGYSVDGQLAELREHSEREGHEIVAAVVDPGEKRWTLDRKGIRKLRELVAAGDVDEVWAWRWDRFGESPWPEVLAIELEESDTVLRSLDDGGVGEDADILRVLRSAMAKKERRRTAERSRMGMLAKARRGEIAGNAPTPRFGFRYVRNEKGTAVAYEVDPETMAHVRRVIAMLAGGESLRGVQREFEQGGVPAPGGGRQWAISTIKRLATEDCYLPRTRDELAGMVSDDVLAELDAEKLYGIAWHGQRRTRYAPGGGKRRVAEWAPRENWIAIPINLTGSGLERAVVDRARAGVANNKKPSSAGDRFWDLSGGLLRCGDCGRAMHTYRRRRRSGGYLYYYRCRPATSLNVCGNRGSHRAEHLEHEAAVMLEDRLGADKIMELFDHALEEHYRRRGLRDSPERRAALTKRLGVIAQMRRGFQEQQAEGLMTIPELRERLAELDEEREGIADELRIVEDAAEEQRDSLAARELIKALAERGQHYLAKPGERRHKEYRQLGARFEVDASGTLTLRLSLDLDALRTDHTRRSVATLPHAYSTMP